jgi:heme A synthase
MWRVALEFLIAVLLPAAVYFLWLAHEQRRIKRLGEGEPPRWQDAPWLWLASAGIALMVVVAVASALFGGDQAGPGYVPPRAVNGEIIPGHVEPPTGR